MIRKKTAKIRGVKYPNVFVEGSDTLYLNVNGVKITVTSRASQPEEQEKKELIKLTIAQGTKGSGYQPWRVEAHQTELRLRKKKWVAD